MKLKKYLLNILLILTIGFISIYLSIGKDFNKVVTVFVHSKLLWIIIMAIIMMFYYLFDGLILYYFGRLYRKDYSFKQAFVNAISGTFFNGITPFASGGQFAQVYIFKKQGLNAAISTSILLMCFISYQCILVLYTGIILLFNFEYFINEQLVVFNLALLGFVINFIVILALFGGAKSKSIQSFITTYPLLLISKLHLIKDYDKSKQKVDQYFNDLRDQINTLQKNKLILIKSFILNFIKLTLIYSMPYLTCQALNIQVYFTDFFQFLGLCSFIYLINAFLPIPGASGGSEGIFILLFSFLGSVEVSSALVLWRFMSYYFGLILGGLVFSLSREINS